MRNGFTGRAGDQDHQGSSGGRTGCSRGRCRRVAHLGSRERRELGRKRWQKVVAEAVERLSAALEPDYIVLGGGNAAKLDQLSPKARLGSNSNAFTGGFRIWQADERSVARAKHARAVNDQDG